MLLVVLMERCNFVSAGIETSKRDISLIDNWSRGSALRGLVVRKLDSKTYDWRFKTIEVMSKETFLASQFVRKFQNVLVSFEVWYITLLLPYLSLCIFLAIDESTIICMILKLNNVL